MTSYVDLYVKVVGTPGPEDEGVPGIYSVAVDEDLTDEDRASASLDIFHEHIGIENLDDFEISVHSEDGVELVQGDTEPYTMGSRGIFYGQLFDDGIPDPLKESLAPSPA